MLADRFDPRYFDRDVLFRWHAGWAGGTFSRASSAWYIDRDGILREAGPNVPRVEWLDLDGDGVRETPIWLAEMERTNGWTWSEALDNAVWAKTGATITVNATTAPDGQTTADKLVEDTSTGGHGVNRVVAAASVTDGGRSAITVFAKAAERSIVQISVTKKDGAITQRAWYDLAAGTVASSVGSPPARIYAIGDGWYRCAMVADNGTGANPMAVFVRISDAAGNITHTGDGASGLYVWGLQFEANASVASSYMRTEGAALTRPVEMSSFPFAYPPSAIGTIYARIVEFGSHLTGATGRVLQIGAADNTNPRLILYNEPSAGNKWTVLLHNGSAQQSSASPVAAQLLQQTELRVVLIPEANQPGYVRVQIHESIDGGPEQAGALSPPIALPAAWSDRLLWLNGVFAGLNGYRDVLVIRGADWTLDEVRRLLP